MRWSIVESKSEEFGYNIVFTGADGVGRVKYGAADYVAAREILMAMENHELLTGGFFVGKPVEPDRKVAPAKKGIKRVGK